MNAMEYCKLARMAADSCPCEMKEETKNGQ